MFALAASATERLVTESFDIMIDVRCAEGVVGCDKIRYTGVNRKTGQSIRLTGKEIHTRCADGVTPCRFLGYMFRNKGITYVVWENGMVTIKRGSKVLVEEQGAWQ